MEVSQTQTEVLVSDVFWPEWNDGITNYKCIVTFWANSSVHLALQEPQILFRYTNSPTYGN